ncbi:helix-turn-helix transcriptional regulator [Aeromicrobium duanguangcaii]|uniref:Helix-turn-helix transcriptional regulator n=1 Tax=Aeromicrobium duanguangcaii TaxID=2968086 RepID=A0ABY5KJA9_9ACTN|nr:helix-turn-helix transcriptional regulator [Aeromicrobium duanguangcaii]MCD9153834.1 helix-turn-helix transcriptional regulator [Aeromicrobium duanguangcaii]MCL3837559.1 helix-turn-helix transcriptional regulator [Aeromicrobium duanguangcaii]UUI69085.1 helix-turn-helix transcriptional regulator [Aeromicrobium duanguangcaii]
MPKRTPSDRTTEVAGAFATWLRRRREELSMTQEELAHQSGLSRNQIQNLENNRNNNAVGRSSANPSLDTVLALEAALGLELGDLMVQVREFMESGER